MAWLKRSSLKSKLILIIFGTTAVSLLTFASFVLYREIRASREDLVHRMTVIARLLGDDTIIDLTFRDQAASLRTLQALSIEPAVRCARIFDAEGNLHSVYHRDSTTTHIHPQLPSQSQHAYQGELLHIFEPIVDSRGIFHGTIYIQMSTETLQEKIRDNVIVMLVAFLILLAVAVFLSVQLQRIISSPILSLAAATRRVSEGQSYAVRAEQSGEDEIGVLSEGFNQMLATIESRDKQRERVEIALRESEARYRSLVESSPDGILVERDGTVAYVNPFALRLFGYQSLIEMKDAGLSELLGEDVTSAKETGTPSPLQKKLVNRKGQEYEVEVSFIPTSYEKEPAIQWIVRDITERVNLALATQRMERLAALGEFSATTAHEIRNSLGSISLNFQYLTEHMQIPDNLRRTFANIEHGIQRIQATIKGILAFTRPSLPVLRKVDIHKVIENSIRSIDDERKHLDISITKELHAKNSIARVDPNQMIQVFTNLFTNSLQSMSNGGKLTIRTSDSGGFLEAVIEDTGKGIKELHLSKIFDPFFTTRTSGTGLGLAVVSRILEQHKVGIEVESQAGVGTRVALHIPIAEDDTS